MNNYEKDIEVLFSEKEIQNAIKRLGDEITDFYKDKNPLVLGVLKGSFMFVADLIRVLNFELEMEFIGLSSYGECTESSGEVTITVKTPDVLEGIPVYQDRHVLVVEDIVDSGNTISFLKEKIMEHSPASVKVCTLTSKPARREVDIPIDYLGFKVPNKFIVGYGMDYNGKYRNLHYIGYLKNPPSP